MSNMPLVTVLFPVYNAEMYLEESLKSILEQTYTELEILAIDDGSTDSSAEILSSIDDPRLKVHTNPKNLGLIQTLNIGIPLAKGKYIVRADSDDICLPTRIDKQAKFMEANPEIGISGSGFGTFGKDKPLTEQGRFSSDHNEILFNQLYQIHIMHGTSIWRTSVMLEHNLRFDPDYSHAEDYEFFDRAGQLTQLSNIPDVLYHVRVHPESVTYQFWPVQVGNSIRVRRRGFRRMGVEVSDEELDLFRNLCHHDHSKLLRKEEEIADLLLRVIESNSRTEYFTHDFMVEKLRELWIGLILNNVKKYRGIITLVNTHPVNEYFRIDALTKGKLYLKTLIG